MQILQPRALDLSALLAASAVGGEWHTKKAREKLACAIHLIVEASHRDRRNESGTFWTPIHSARLEKILGYRHAAPAMRALQALGVIEINKRYSSGRFPKSYRLAEPYRADDVTLRELSDETLAANLAREDSDRTEKAIGADPTRTFVWESLQQVRVSPDSAGALAHVDEPSRRAALAVALSDFERQRYWLRADDETGRGFHNVTQCPRELRPFLQLAGEPAVEVDIGSAQPFFALALYEDDSEERARFAEAVTSEDFYARVFHLMQPSARRSWGGDIRAWTAQGSTDRDRFKTHVLRHVFYDVIRTSCPAVWTAFVEAFQELGTVLMFSRKTKADTSALAKRLQKAEADLMLGRIIPRLREELPCCPIVSLHDGLLVPERSAEHAKAVVEAESEAHFKVRPRVRVKCKTQRPTESAGNTYPNHGFSLGV